MGDELSLRQFQASDGEAINHLFAQVFSVDRSLAQWRWKFLDNPHGPALVLIAETESKQLAGHYGLMPRKIRFKGQITIGYQEVDLMIHRQLASPGLFRKLGSQIYKLAQTHASFTFGFPNQTSLPAGKRILKWKIIHPIPLHTFIGDPLAVLNQHRRLGFLPQGLNRPVRALRQLYLEGVLRSRDPCKEVTVIFDAIDELLQRSCQSELSFIRDRDYLAWRYMHPPDTPFRFLFTGSEADPSGFAIFRVQAGEMCLAEMFLDPAREWAAAKGILHYLANAAAESRCHVIRAWALANSRYSIILNKLGFWKRDSRNYLVIRSFLSPEDNRLLWDPDRWYISWGDSDCV